MPERKPNHVARFAAVLALLGAFTLVAVTVVGTNGGSGGGGGGGGGGGETVERTEPSQRANQAVQRGVYRVQEGDTLAQIAQETGVELNTLLELNPDLDPQALSPGQRVRLR